MLSKSINVAIVDNRTLFRKTLKDYLSGHPNINVVIQTAEIENIHRKLIDYDIHILLIDVYSPDSNAHDTIQQIKRLCPDIKILVLSINMDMNLLSELLDLDIAGYISEFDEPEDLLRAILSLSNERIYKNKMFTEILYWNKQNNRPVATDTNVALNDREKELIRLLWEEKSNKEISHMLFLSVRSVEKLRQDLKEKLGVKSTVGLLKYALSKKIIPVRRTSFVN